MARIVEKLNLDFFVGYEECAKICLLEDEYHEAYLYLRRLGDCQNQNLLDLLCSYSLYDYISLMKYYQRKKKVYQWVPSH